VNEGEADGSWRWGDAGFMVLLKLGSRYEYVYDSARLCVSAGLCNLQQGLEEGLPQPQPLPIASQLRASARCALGRDAIEQNRRGDVIEDGSGGQAVKNHSFQALPKTPLSCQPPLFSAVPAVAAVGLVHPAQK
jgi:hypothetical protein